jgi:hypothetical protein
MTDSHHLLEAWLVDGAVGDPPRELAVHASVCESCARRLGAFDSLATIDVDAAGSPPPLAAPTRVAVWLAWARLTTAVAGTVVAGILVVFGATQLVGLVGLLDGNPGPSDLVGLATPMGRQDSPGPDPAVEPSLVAEPSGTPIPSFIPLPSQAPNELPPDPPDAPALSLNGVGTTFITVQWTPSGGGGPVQKWEIWRKDGSFGSWFKLGEVFPDQLSLTNTGLSPGTTYSYRVRAANTAWLGSFSNSISVTTSVPPGATPSPSIPPTPSPSLPSPQCSDGLDNDADGWVDWPSDSACTSASADDESPPNPHECNNGIDDDSDGYTDFPGDPGCLADFDDTESPPNTCADGLDNDGDHLIDFGEDPSCGSSTDTEASFDSFECNDGVDNEAIPDGLIDFGGAAPDPGCTSWSDPVED